jgi:RimJ/RimL family protein N-acetyltransferase
MLQGTKVSLRPLKAGDLPLFAAWDNDDEHQGSFNNFGLRWSERLHRDFAENGLLGGEKGTLAIVLGSTARAEEVIGLVSYRQVSYGPMDTSKAYNIGISITARHRGQGYGVEAQQLLAVYLFATYPVMRVEATTDIENVAEQRALEKAGFTREGVIRSAQWRNGAWHDMVLYSRLRGE